MHLQDRGLEEQQGYSSKWQLWVSPLRDRKKFLVFTHMMRQPCWCTQQWQNVAQNLHDNKVKFPKEFFAIVLCINMAAVTSRENPELETFVSSA